MALISVNKNLMATGFQAQVGSFHYSGLIKENKGVGSPRMRTLGAYAVVFVAEGNGRFADSLGFNKEIEAGDLIFLYPEIAHRYGPEKGQTWSEFYLVFSGVAFDLWRDAGILNSAQPVVPVTPVLTWLERWMALVANGDFADAGDQIGRVVRLLEMLSDAVRPISDSNSEAGWLRRTKAMLSADLDADIDVAEVAESVGMSYETFRKRFTRETGFAPIAYRNDVKVQSAKLMLKRTEMSLRQIAESLGYLDEFYFSNRFKKANGISPSQYRSRKVGD